MLFCIHIILWHPMASVWMVGVVPIVWAKRLRSQGACYDYNVTGQDWHMVGLGGVPSAPTLVASEGLLHSVELSDRQGEACSLGPFGSLAYSKGNC